MNEGTSRSLALTDRCRPAQNNRHGVRDGLGSVLPGGVLCRGGSAWPTVYPETPGVVHKSRQCS
jgi:hypothetical protein